jgi:hypothetical protein
MKNSRALKVWKLLKRRCKTPFRMKMMQLMSPSPRHPENLYTTYSFKVLKEISHITEAGFCKT